jgi:hypothetical protein
MRKYNHTHREENNQYHETNRDARLDSMKEHHEANRDASLDSMRKYNHTHREENKQYHETNRDARLNSMRKYNHTHREENKQYHETNRDARLDSMRKYNHTHREENKQYHETNRDARLDSMKEHHEANRDASLDSMRNYHKDNRDARLDSMKKYDNACREEKRKILESTRVNFTNTDSSHRIEMEPGEGVDRHFSRHQDCPEANTFLNHITTYKNHFTGNPENPHEFNILRNQIRAQFISAEKQRDVAQKFLLSQGRGCEWAEETLGKKCF